MLTPSICSVAISPSVGETPKCLHEDEISSPHPHRENIDTNKHRAKSGALHFRFHKKLLHSRTAQYPAVLITDRTRCENFFTLPRDFAEKPKKTGLREHTTPPSATTSEPQHRYQDQHPHATSQHLSHSPPDFSDAAPRYHCALSIPRDSARMSSTSLNSLPGAVRSAITRRSSGARANSNAACCRKNPDQPCSHSCTL